MGVFDFIKGVVGDSAKEGVFSKIAKSAVPMILMAIFNNVIKGDGAKSLIDALGQHENGDGSLLDSAGDIYDKVKNSDITDGGKILKKVFGSNVDSIVAQISDKTGIDSKDALNVLSSVAPKVLEMLASKTSGNRSADSIGGIIKDELNKIDITDGLPNLPGKFKDILGGGSDNDNILGKMFGDDNDDSNVLGDIIGGFLK